MPYPRDLIKSNKELVRELYMKGLPLLDISNELKLKLGTVAHIISVYGFNKEIKRINTGRFTSTHQYTKRHKFTSEKSKAIQKKQWELVRLGKHIIRRSRKEGVINPAWDIKGRLHPFWNGGITPLRMLIRNLPEMREWRKEVFKRDKYICQECGKIGGELNAHHKKSFHIILKEFIKEYHQFSIIEDKETLARLAITYKPFWDINNGITLCNDCHRYTLDFLWKARRQNG